MTFVRNFWNDEQGQDLIEYTLLMAFVALASAALFMGAGGSHVRRLTSSRADDLAAGWSPDGRKVLFTSDRNGSTQIFVMNLDRTHMRNLSGKRSNEFDPSWR